MEQKEKIDQCFRQVKTGIITSEEAAWVMCSDALTRIQNIINNHNPITVGKRGLILNIIKEAQKNSKILIKV